MHLLAINCGRRMLTLHTLCSRGGTALLASGRWSDVTFRAMGDAGDKPAREVRAHRPVLCARSSYFRAMFQSGLRESEAAASLEEVEVEVPDSHEGLLRLLSFMYSGAVDAVTTEDLLTDLVAADRYGIEGLKCKAAHTDPFHSHGLTVACVVAPAACESLVTVAPDNAARVLELADLVSAPLLREVPARLVQ